MLEGHALFLSGVLIRHATARQAHGKNRRIPAGGPPRRRNTPLPLLDQLAIKI